MAIEAGDDIEEVSKGGTVYYQLKHRAPGVSLTDAGTDLWKTLRIWAHAIASHQLDPEETDLVLMTTAELPSGIAAYSRLVRQPCDQAHPRRSVANVRLRRTDAGEHPSTSGQPFPAVRRGRRSGPVGFSSARA
ncbi:hypothetical protein [Streptomyces sp. NPDC006551]|uniref:hypothetical protein n=1 Tax=Streptomyces sp. NPDC006551 TaxID=3157178 RepID=UPI0033A34CEE